MPDSRLRWRIQMASASAFISPLAVASVTSTSSSSGAFWVDSVQAEKAFGCAGANPLIPIDEGMFHDQRMSDRGEPCRHLRVKILAAQGDLWPRDRRLRATLFAKEERSSVGMAATIPHE